MYIALWAVFLPSERITDDRRNVRHSDAVKLICNEIRFIGEGCQDDTVEQGLLVPREGREQTLSSAAFTEALAKGIREGDIRATYFKDSCTLGTFAGRK
jgi:hypothetical protein